VLSWWSDCVADRPGQEQHRVAELVPQVVLRDRGAIGRVDQVRSRDGLQQGQVARLGCVPPSGVVGQRAAESA
jgi:hypothetical protein